MTQKTRQIQTGLIRGDILTVSTFNRIYTIITLGIFVVIVLNMLTRTRKTVINRVILDRQYILFIFLEALYNYDFIHLHIYLFLFISQYLNRILFVNFLLERHIIE